jgi:hypothetical protein
MSIVSWTFVRAQNISKTDGFTSEDGFASRQASLACEHCVHALHWGLDRSGGL